jgi:hypothetical protein
VRLERTTTAPHRSPEDRAALQRFRQVARGERDDDRVVAGEHQVDDDDRAEGGPEFRGQEHAPSLDGACREEN